MFPLGTRAHTLVINIPIPGDFIVWMRGRENQLCMIHSDFFATGFVPVPKAKSYLGDDRIAKMC